MSVADKSELEAFLAEYPETRTLEILMPDMNGMLRCKRIDRRDFDTLFSGGLKCPMSTSVLNCISDIAEALDPAVFAGDPDQAMLPVSGSLATVPWLESPTAQVLVGLASLGGEPAWVDPRNILTRVLKRYADDGLSPVVATEMEFYLVAGDEGDTPQRVLARVPGTDTPQRGIQYCIAQDLWQFDAFLEDIRKACEAQNIPLSAIHSEFSEGQWEINTLHVDDPLLGCDQAALFKRLVKGVALQHGFNACFMAKPFAEVAGSGLHIHTSVYDAEGGNLFSVGEGDAEPGDVPEFGDALVHAIGGLAATMVESMAIFAPNANSYRRLKPETFAPVTPSWGYNHRDVSLRIPVSSPKNRRVEHRVSGADANPYLVVAAVLAGIHHGITQRCEPGEPVHAGTELELGEALLPMRWEYALDAFSAATVLPGYLGHDYCEIFALSRQFECDQLHYVVPNTDYEWYLRVV